MIENVEKYCYATPLKHTILNLWVAYFQLENFSLQINANI